MKHMRLYYTISTIFITIVNITNSLTITPELARYTTITNIQSNFDDFKNAFQATLLPKTKVLKIKLNANIGSGKWIIPMQYYDGIHFGDGCDYSPRGTWLCTNVNEIEIEGIPHLTKPYPGNVPIISGNDHSRIFWVAGAKLKVSNIIVEKGRTIYGGSGIYVLSKSIVNLYQIQFLKHTAKYASALYMEASGDSSIINATQCTFKENLVLDGLQGGAVGIYGAGTNLVTLLNNIFTRNKFYAPNGLGQDVYKQSDSSILYDVDNTYDKTGTLWGLRIVCPTLKDLEFCISTKFSQVSKDSGDCLCLPRQGEDVSFKPTTNHQSFVPPMIIDRNLNNWRGDGFSVPGLQKNVCAEQQYPQRGFKEKDTKCNFV